MATTVQQAREIVYDSVLHTYDSSFDLTKLDRAIIAACNRFLRETHVARTSRSISVTTGTIEYDLDDEVGTGFRSDQIIGVPHIASSDWRPLQVVDYDIVRREFDTTAATGRPELVAFNGDKAVVYPTPDDNYTVTLQTWDLLNTTGWTVGGTDGTTLAVTLNIPDRWAHDVLWFGARGYLLLGAPGHPDAAPAMSEFMDVVIRGAKGEGNRGGSWWASARGTHEQTYGPRPRL
jgi:hypothetical protein